MLSIPYQKLHPHARLPQYATQGSAGADLHACLEAPLPLAPLQRAMVRTGIAIQLPSPDWVALLCARSGLAVKSGVTLINAVGVIDSDFRGEICVGLVNLSQNEYTIHSGDRIAQLVLLPTVQGQFSLAPALGATLRGAGGFGSSGK